MPTRKTNQLKPAETLPAPRLAVSQTALAELGLDLNTWRVLTESICPSAKTAEGVLLAVRYCQARGLDVLKRPVYVVPMWSKAHGREIETIWPGINEVQITAARTGQWAGMDTPTFGPDITCVFQGRARTESGWQDVQVEVTYPEWAEVTVYRLVAGQRCPFSETVFWEEAYARTGSDVPNAMWIRRPRGQLLKCAKAASLRAAFPEEAGYTAEAMAGKSIEPEDVVLDRDTAPVDAEVIPENKAQAGPSTEIDPEVIDQVQSLVERAAKSRAWASAEEYFRRRLQGADLEYALEALTQAERAANTQAEAA